jgi:hypothetical protein
MPLLRTANLRKSLCASATKKIMFGVIFVVIIFNNIELATSNYLSMKTKKLLFVLLIFGVLLANCKKEFNPEEWVRGRWVNEYSDTICFSSSIMLINKMPYSFKIDNDSLKVIPSWSSSLQEFDHKIEFNKSEDKIYIYDFLTHTKSSFKRQLICDCLALK